MERTNSELPLIEMSAMKATPIHTADCCLPILVPPILFVQDSPVCATGIAFQQQEEQDMLLGRKRDHPSRQNLKQSRRKQPKGRVRFALDSNMEIQRHYQEATICLTNDDLKTSWWSRRELFNIYRAAKKVAADFKQEEAASLEGFKPVFKLCFESSSLRQILESSCSQILVRQREGCRGVERFLHPVLSSYRLMHRKTLLGIQSSLPADATPGAKERLLSAKSMQISKPSKTLAKLLAHGDSVESADMIRRELIEYSSSTRWPLFQQEEYISASVQPIKQY
jgi:hypothetical protein